MDLVLNNQTKTNQTNPTTSDQIKNFIRIPFVYICDYGKFAFSISLNEFPMLYNPFVWANLWV